MLEILVGLSDKLDNESPAATCDSLNFLLARDPPEIGEVAIGLVIAARMQDR